MPWPTGSDSIAHHTEYTVTCEYQVLGATQRSARPSACWCMHAVPSRMVGFTAQCRHRLEAVPGCWHRFEHPENRQPLQQAVNKWLHCSARLGRRASSNEQREVVGPQLAQRPLCSVALICFAPNPLSDTQKRTKVGGGQRRRRRRLQMNFELKSGGIGSPRMQRRISLCHVVVSTSPPPAASVCCASCV
jgi:hypothetical protein